jgi:hypothetical protein
VVETLLINKNYMYSLLKSRTVWTVVAMFVIGGLNAIIPVIPADLQTGLMAVLGIAAAYFHVNPSQTYNTPQQ